MKNEKKLQILMLAKMGENCEKSNFTNNLSIFICNIFFTKLKNKNTLINNNLNKS
jgi:phosphoribosylformylglycinamidine (FGAM) synthase-like amidotransferase family enzyme